MVGTKSSNRDEPEEPGGGGEAGRSSGDELGGSGSSTAPRHNIKKKDNRTNIYWSSTEAKKLFGFDPEDDHQDVTEAVKD